MFVAFMGGSALNWPDVVVAGIAVVGMIVTFVGGQFKVLQRIDSLGEKMDHLKDRDTLHEKRVDDHETRIRALEKSQ